MANVVRVSKFRHVYGTAYKREQCYDNLKISTHSSTEGNVLKVNPLFIAINWEVSGGGSFAVIPHERRGRFNTNDIPLFLGHSSQVIDVEFSPFNDHLIASCSDDASIALWQIPNNGPTANIEEPLSRLLGHARKVTILLFHPVASNLLASASADLTIRLWNIETGEEKQCISGHSDAIYSMCFNYNGTTLATTCKDKTIRLFDVRTGKLLQNGPCHQGIKSTQILWLGNTNYIATTGFSKISDRQVMIWDAADLSQPILTENLDTSSGVLMPFFDADTSILYLAGKGDGNIRYYEFTSKDVSLHYLSEYKSSDPQRGIAFLQKRALNVSENEISRAYKVLSSCIEPISFKVTRKSDSFQEDIYPDAIGPNAPLTCEEFFAGKDANPVLICLRDGFKPSTTTAPVSLANSKEFSEPKGVSSASNYLDKDALIAELRKQNKTLQDLVAEQDIEIADLTRELAVVKNN